MSTTEASSFFGYQNPQSKDSKYNFAFFCFSTKQETSCEEVAPNGRCQEPLPFLPGNQSPSQIHCEGCGTIRLFFSKRRTQYCTENPPLKGIIIVFVYLTSNMGYGQYFWLDLGYKWSVRRGKHIKTKTHLKCLLNLSTYDNIYDLYSVRNCLMFYMFF